MDRSRAISSHLRLSSALNDQLRAACCLLNRRWLELVDSRQAISPCLNGHGRQPSGRWETGAPSWCDASGALAGLTWFRRSRRVET